MSKVKVKISYKWVKYLKTYYNSDAILPTDFMLSTKVQLNKVHSMTQVPMILIFGLVKVKGQSQNFQKMCKKTKQLVISRMLFHVQISYLVLMCNPFNDLSADDHDPGLEMLSLLAEFLLFKFFQPF